MNKRIALITGATGTLGKAITHSLINQNIELVLLSKNTKKLEILFWKKI